MSTTFSLASRSLKLDTAADIDQHISLLLTSPSTIKTIDLSGNTIGVPAALALAPHLSACTSLESANLADIFTSRLLSEIPQALDALLTALLECKRLTTLNLSDNAFGLNTQAPLTAFLPKALPLRHLILNNNGLGPQAGTLIANALRTLSEAKAAAGAPPLETVICGRNRLEDGSMPAWAAMLGATTELTTIRMAQNGIRPKGIELLLQKGIRGHCAKLEVLDLQDNTFDAKRPATLADVLKGVPTLKELNVGDCLVGKRGAQALCEMLAAGGCKELEVLKVQYNVVDAKAVESLVKGVKSGALPKLRRCELNGNKLVDDPNGAVEALREVLEERQGDAEGEGEYGLDDLSDLEEDSDEDEDEDDENEEAEDEGDTTVAEKAEHELRLADEAENQDPAQDADKGIDDLADSSLCSTSTTLSVFVRVGTTHEHYRMPRKKLSVLMLPLRLPLIAFVRSSLAFVASGPAAGRSTVCSYTGILRAEPAFAAAASAALARLFAMRRAFADFANDNQRCADDRGDQT
ncbi:hypothetical protein MRB53_037413 [Persea americana]|nr:hypothetical protein MRB53_037413 [Persea americana]